ncbi:uncharacterized protein LOC141600800 [Silene latifolia]|uniref:uncharacterized protein LOC141600800 n=1 Tax=Silene latifolia TaxID=37657 RepID=UPI003D779F2E
MCYILGANPPWALVEDYIYTVWGRFGVERVSFLDNGVFLVRFTKNEDRDALLQSGYYLYDNKPIVIKPWTVDMELVKAKVDVVPVWVKLFNVPLKFWGSCLPAIAGLVGKFVKKDQDTHEKVRLSYARVMVELAMDQPLPAKVKFLDESGNLVFVPVEYEWKPISCTSCNGIGHNATQCKRPVKKPSKPKQKAKQVWKPVQIDKVQVAVVNPVSNSPILTPTNFPPLHTVRSVPIQSTPAKNIMRLNRQENVVGHIHMVVTSRADNKTFKLTMVYAFNGLEERVALWNILKEISLDCALFTWYNKQNPADRVYNRLDRAMGNQAWLEEFGDNYAHFHPEGLFDHCPCTVLTTHSTLGGKKNFKYFNMWGSASQFKNIVENVWSIHVQRTKMFSIIKKLKALKPALKSLNKCCFSDIENSTTIATVALENIQKMLVENPGDIVLLQQEMDMAHDLKELISARDSFLIQKAKVQWSLEGDLNTNYFHHAIKKRIYLNKVFQIEDMTGRSCTDGDSIQAAFLEYYQSLLGSQTETEKVNLTVVRNGACCTAEHWNILSKPVTAEEVKQCLFSIPKGKSPGPDGYGSQFFRDAWEIIGDEICVAVQNFFDTGKLLTQINATIITLIPKMERPETVKHYRPISCCNVIYKTISKLLCARLAVILPDIINRNQGAFVKGRSILENIFICQDLVRLYNRGMASPRCMFKMDLHKAYDTIEWKFVDQMLSALKFPPKFHQLIMACLTSPTYTLNLNGAHFGYFPGKRGLRQGDPISPLLFCICMEYLSRIMHYAANTWHFRYHTLCKSLKLTHLLFADDLLMFCKGDSQSIMLLLRVMATFSAASGLKVNAAKSEVVFNGVAANLKADIIQVSGFQEGTLPFKYLGIPIQPGRLLRRDCKILTDKIVRKIRGIGARKLSYAGRLVLINFVLNTLHNYWASIFLIPKCVIHQIEAICRNFLWDNSSEYNRAPLVAWNDICHTKREGGLGIKNAGVWNVASVGKLVHWLYTKADRLWELWIDHVYLKGADWELLSGGYQGHHWTGQPTGTGYTVSSGYCWLQGTHPHVQWYSDVWSIWNIPKHAFIGWLVQRKALNTRVKLARLSLCISDRCFLCEAAAESHKHLFTDCVYTSKVNTGVENWLHLTLTGSVGYTKLQRKICRLAKMAIWYNIWYVRNICRLEHKVKKPEYVVSEIIAQVRQRIVHKIDSIEKLKNRDWLVKLNICLM